MDRCEALRGLFVPICSSRKTRRPTFMYHTFTDQTVPVEQGSASIEALVKAGVPSEMHIFANGAHGSGLGKGDPALDQWPEPAGSLAARAGPVARRTSSAERSRRRHVPEPCTGHASCRARMAQKVAQKLRSGPPASGVEGLPETGRPLDPGPGLGGMFSLGLFAANASPFLHEYSRFVTRSHRTPSRTSLLRVDLRASPLIQKRVPPRKVLSV